MGFSSFSENSAHSFYNRGFFNKLVLGFIGSIMKYWMFFMLNVSRCFFFQLAYFFMFTFIFVLKLEDKFFFGEG